MSHREHKILIICALGFFLIFLLASLRHAVEKQNCYLNLKQIDGAMQLWAEEHHKQTNAIPTWTDLKPYLKGKNYACPLDGAYSMGSVAQGPICSIRQHNLEYGTVYVCETDGTALPGATVSVYRRATILSSRMTDSNGWIRTELRNYPSSESALRIVVSKEGYREETSAIDVQWPIRLHLQQEAMRK